jgi:soluble lytic murein transglycosylase-like protein
MAWSPTSHRRLLVAILLLLPAGGPATAELVLLGGGEVLKVAAYEVGEESARLRLPGGGVLTLPLERIERIVADEVVPEPEPEVAAVAAPAALDLGFDAAQPIPDTPFGALIWEAARRHALNPALVAAVVRTESAFDPGAVSRKGACGLMQLMPATGRRFGLQRTELFDVEKNLDAGARYLAWLAGRFAGDLPRILAAYNAGEGTVERYSGVPPYRETREYIRRVYTTLGLSLA